MKVTAYGVSLKAGNLHISLENLFDRLHADSGKSQTLHGADRIIYFDKDSDNEFVRGLIVTVKDQSKFCELIKEHGGNFKIKVNNLEEQNKVMEFNFFLINKSNGLGIYQHYYHSCALTTFQAHLRRTYRALSNAARDAKIKSLGTKATKKAVKKVRAEYYAGLSAATLFRKETLEEYLKGYKELNGFSYEVASLHVHESIAQPLTGLVTRKREHIYFEPSASRTKVVNAIKGMLPNLKPNSARVSVTNADDETQSVRISDIPDKYDIQDYDDIAAGIDSLNVKEFYKHPLLVSLRKVCTHTHKATFMAKLTDEE